MWSFRADAKGTAESGRGGYIFVAQFYLLLKRVEWLLQEEICLDQKEKMLHVPRLLRTHKNTLI